MKSLYLLLLFALISFSSNNTIEDKIKCLIQNEKIIKNVLKIIDSIKSGEDLTTILSKVFFAYIEVKDDIKKCLVNEPILKAGCRYEEQFIYCRKHSCEYMDDYTCMEYCYRKYC
jgi:hypothetical protein